MTPLVATAICITAMVGLFVFSRERDFKGSWKIWIPTTWLLISGSRHVSSWFAVGGEGSNASTLTTQRYLEGSPVDASVYALLIAAALAVLMGRRKAVVSIVGSNWPIICFVIYCVLSITWSDFPGVALKRWIKSLGDYAMILVLLTERNRWAAIRTTLARVSFVLLPLSILFIKYYPDLGRAHAGQWEVGATMIGVSDNKNMLGLASLVFGFTAFDQVLEIQNRPRRDRLRILIVNGAVVAMALYILLLCQSMTSLSCFVLAGGVVVAHRFFRAARNHVVLHSLVATVVACSLSVLFLGAGDSALQQIGRNPTLTGRTAIWEILRTVPVNPIIGTGFESFWLGPRLNYLWSFQILYGITEA